MNTHTFKLPSGVEAEVGELTGKHQRILTQQDGEEYLEKMLQLSADVIKRVGTTKNPDREFIKKMLSADWKTCMVEARQFSLGFPDSFSFVYKYKNEEGTEEVEKEMSFDLEEEGFPRDDYPDQMEDYTGKDEFYHEGELPRSKDKYRFKLTQVEDEGKMAGLKKKNISSHTPIKLRNPQYFRAKDGKEGTWIQCDLDNMPLLDIEHLRKQIKLREGRIHTEVKFDHPLGKKAPEGEEQVVVDMLSEVSFFFPSGGI